MSSSCCSSQVKFLMKQDSKGGGVMVFNKSKVLPSLVDCNLHLTIFMVFVEFLNANITRVGGASRFKSR